MIYTPWPYQQHAEQHIIDNPYSALFMEMGLGKTVTTLTATSKLLAAGAVRRVLVIAPKRVAEDTWISEKDKWDHLRHLKLSIVLGSERERKEALRAKADIYVINRENIVWLTAQYGGAFPFDMVIIDESSSFKNASAQRFKALRRVRPLIQRVVLLTGTPSPNGLIDLWPQLYLLDMGERLGKTLTGYREKYFKASKSNDHVVYEYSLRKGDDLLGEDIYKQEIYEKIGDICISMKTEDWLQLPERIDNIVNITMPEHIRQQYLDFERKMVMEIADTEVTAINAAALGTKLLQYSNGAVYDADKAWHSVHDEKLQQLEEIIETANGNPVLVFYNYDHDWQRIEQHLRKYKPKKLESRADIIAWNKGEIHVMAAHPASAGHGLNLQAGGNIIVWFGLNWNLEYYQQANTRIHRQGQTKAVIIHHLICKGTIDEKVMLALERKAGGQEALMQAVKARIFEILQKQLV